MLIILDWDHTLYDTQRFKQDLAEVLKTVGLPKKIFFATYANVVKHDGERYDYNYLEHVELLKKCCGLTAEDAKRLKRGFLSVMRHGRRYLFPETVGFLKSLRKSGARLVLCTWGNPTLQRRKIKSSGIKKYFDLISLTPVKKHNVIHKLIKRKRGEKVYFVSDNPFELKEVARRLPFIRPIMKARADKREELKEARRLNMPVFSTLKKIGEFIVKHRR